MSKQKKTGKGCWIAMLGIGLLACAGLAAMIFLKLCPPQGPWSQPPWCEGSPFTQAAIADLQPDLAPLQFTVFVPPNTPPNTILYLELYDPDKNGIGNYALDPVSETEWALKNPWVDNELEKYKTLYYRYNRNNWGYAGAEELSPDSPNTFRTIRIEDEPSTITDTVAQWRWLPKEGERLPVVQPHVQPFAARVNDMPFQNGALLADFWWNIFDNFIASTNQQLRSSHIQWVAISPTWDYLQTEPLPVIGIAGHSYKDAQLENHLAQLRADGFEVLMMPQICCTLPDPNTFNDAWWQEWLTQYRAYLFHMVDTANQYEVPYFATEASYIIDDNIPQAYKTQLEDLFAEAHARYNGEMGTLLYVMGNAEDSIYCQQTSTTEAWDFLGINMWAGIATNSDPSHEELVANTLEVFDTCLRPLYEEYQVPIVLTQIAYPSVDGGLMGKVDVFEPAIQLWEPYSDTFILDLEEQAMGYDAVMQAVAETPYILGTYPFVYYPDAFPMSKEYNIRDKPAEQVLSEWYKSLAP